jgi:hypothetical protein
MKNFNRFIFLSFTALLLTTPVNAKTLVDCNRGESLGVAISHAKPNDTINFTGICNGPLLIKVDGLILLGQGTAIIDGQKQATLTIRGVQNVVLANLEVRNGTNGIQLEAQATLNNVTSSGNGLSGLDLESTSTAVVTGQFLTEDNRVFGINVNGGSNLTLSKAQIIAQRNLLGIQLGTGANGFIADPKSAITVNDNLSTGLTVVSGSHLVSFGGTIIAHHNGRNGVSVNSKAGLDLDAASVLEIYKNGGDGLRMAENSVMTMFNTTAFSGAPGNTTLKSHDNAGNGINVLTGSTLTLVNQVLLESQQNGAVGVLADNGSTVTLLGATVTGNKNSDVSFSFGSRADINTSSFGSITCDQSVLIRGDTKVTCPTL